MDELLNRHLDACHARIKELYARYDTLGDEGITELELLEDELEIGFDYIDPIAGA